MNNSQFKKMYSNFNIAIEFVSGERLDRGSKLEHTLFDIISFDKKVYLPNKERIFSMFNEAFDKFITEERKGNYDDSACIRVYYQGVAFGTLLPLQITDEVCSAIKTNFRNFLYNPYELRHRFLLSGIFKEEFPVVEDINTDILEGETVFSSLCSATPFKDVAMFIRDTEAHNMYSGLEKEVNGRIALFKHYIHIGDMEFRYYEKFKGAEEWNYLQTFGIRDFYNDEIRIKSGIEFIAAPIVDGVEPWQTRQLAYDVKDRYSAMVMVNTIISSKLDTVALCRRSMVDETLPMEEFIEKSEEIINEIVDFY